MIKLKSIIFLISLFIFVSTTYAEDINTYDADVLETDMTYSDTMELDKKRIISSDTVIDEDEDKVRTLIKDRVIPDKTDVFGPNTHMELDKNVKVSSRRLTPTSPRFPSPAKSTR